MKGKYITLTNKRTALLVLVISVLISVLYAMLHELGHAISAKLFGAEVYEINFNLFNAHVSSSLGKLNSMQRAIVNLSGTLFPLLISYILVFANKRNNLLSFISMLLFISCQGSLIALFIPLNNGDTVNFMSNSGLSQLLVSVIFGSIFIIGLFYLYKSGIINRLKSFHKELDQKYSRMQRLEYLKHLSIISFILIILLLFSKPYNKEEIINNYDKVFSTKLNEDRLEKFEFVKMNCLDNDTLLIKTKDFNAKLITFNILNKITMETKTVFTGEGVSGNPSSKIVPKKGEISFLLTGEKLKGEISIYRKRPH